MRLGKSVAALVLGAAALFSQQVPRPSGEFAVGMNNGSQILLSQYSGKVVLLMCMFTTCPHCQHTTQLLNGIAKDYVSRGVQFVAAAFNDGAPGLVPAFVMQFQPAFPVGFATREQVNEFLQHPPGKPTYVPELVFIDRNRVIRGQFSGTDDFFKDQDKSIRAELDSLLKEPVAVKKNGHSRKKPS
ncbi:MAG TPA: TlpA disulfide reductase family protein [Bryobacteraceae bacterium]|nr:TlpA disulfide reductase family protein [Bryobacteraceae bacterium]HUJ20053.1 TlpA disulfide reductase family protein [Bryobacteraceae bacterium]